MDSTEKCLGRELCFSSIPGGHANPDALWGISDWSVGKNLLLFTNGKEDYKVMFKVKDGVILTVIGEAYANGYFLVEDLETAKAKGASASLIKALESWRNLAGAESTAKTVFVNTIRP
ncbi:MAG: hypothetical protein NT091_05315 [Candidatus Falkowbacteria bacterium]|nr:hypothetical protein [Candidatus Falkowbacteria bacterium]